MTRVIDADALIVGAGFSGSLLALILKKLGFSVALAERQRHPRFAIGESSTPLANLIWERLCRRYELNALAPLAKWGSWQQSRPEIACGLKRGFSFYYHAFDQPWPPASERANQWLVAASPRDAIADTHWFRADFDSFLAQEAQRAGVVCLDQIELDKPEFRPGAAHCRARRLGAGLSLRCQFIIDATGPRGFLHRALALPEAPFSAMPETAGIFSHFRGVRRWTDLFPPPPQAPYPPDAAAVHHVFPGGWIWALRFNNEIVSAGAAVTRALSDELGLGSGESGWQRLLRRLPSLDQLFAESKRVQPFASAPRLPFLSGRIVGPQWLLLPSAAGFVDPLLSTGFALTLLGIERVAEMFARHWRQADWSDRLFQYSVQTSVELSIVERLVAALYAAMDDFELFCHVTLLYFAAVTFTETAWRLGKNALAGGAFLLGENPEFGLRARRRLDQTLRRAAGKSALPKQQLLDAILKTIEPFDVAGFADRSRWPWFPARAEDLFANASKLGATPEEIRLMLARAGF